MAGFTDDGELLILDHMLGTASYTSGAVSVRLMTANGSDSAAGTEVTGGSYAAKDVTFSAASAGAASNSADLVWTGMPAVTVAGVEIWNKAGTPVRLAYGSLSAAKTLASGDEFKIAAGSLTVTLD